MHRCRTLLGTICIILAALCFLISSVFADKGTPPPMTMFPAKPAATDGQKTFAPQGQTGELVARKDIARPQTIKGTEVSGAKVPATDSQPSGRGESVTPPTNDNYTSATAIGDVTSLAFTTIDATFDGPGSCNNSPNVWYCYTATCNGSVTVSLCGSAYDTYLGVYSGCNPIGALIGCNDDFCGLSSGLSFSATIGTTYIIEIGGYSGQTGTGLLTVSCAVPPANDNCSSVTPGTLPMTAAGSMAGATLDCYLLSYPEVWEAFTITECQDIKIEYCGEPSAIGNAYIVLAEGCPCGSLRYAASYNFYECANGNPTINWFSVPAGTYYYPVLSDPYYNPAGHYKINITGTACPPPPANDNCSSVTPGTLPMTATGTTIGATVDCPALGYPEVWEAFTITECMNVNISYCGTTPAFGNIFIVLSATCPCDGNFIFDTFYEFSSCGDGNGTVSWFNLPAGTYYYPILFDPFYAAGPYTINITGVPCPPPPPNDDCTSVTPLPLPLTASGNTLGATPDCPILGGIGEVWEAFTITECQNVKVDYCTTSPAFQNGYIVMAEGCPCGNLVYANFWDFGSCGDGNVTINWLNLPAGTYYYPVMLDYAYGAVGPYTINISGVPCPIPCTAGGGCDEYISRVQVDGVDNPSSCFGYADYTGTLGLDVTMLKGNSYPITITNGTPVYSGDQCGIWVDWNLDGDFFDVGEAAEVFGNPGVGPYTATLTPPESAPDGDARLRIRITWIGTVSPCGMTSYGEVEDYLVHIITPPPTATIWPNPQYAYYKFAVDPITDTVYFGNFADDKTAAEVNLASITINGLTPSGAIVVPSYPGFVGEVVCLTIPLIDFLDPYGLLFDVTVQDFTVAFEFTDATPSSITGQVTLIGKSSLIPAQYLVPPVVIIVPGDFDLSGTIDISDPVALVGYIFNGETGPSNLLIGDADCSAAVDISDVVAMIAYIFSGGAPPCAAGN